MLSQRTDGSVPVVLELSSHAVDGFEVRVPVGELTHRFRLGHERRPGSGPLFHGDPHFRLPAIVLPAVRRDGTPVPKLDPVLREHRIEGVASAELLLIDPRNDGTGIIVEARWIQGATEAAIDEITRALQLAPGLYIHENEQVSSLGLSFSGPTWLQRLPRMVLKRDAEIADNTDIVLSMGSLLENFIERFSGPDHALEHVRIVSGYLYREGFGRTLKLLENARIKSVRLLFSGRTDRATARALTALLDMVIRSELDNDLNASDLWNRLHAAVTAKRFEVRVYTDAFLHAKLFLAFDGIDRLGKLRNGYAVVGSSNVSAPGLHHGGNLELDVSVHDRDRTTALNFWFERRWEEASEPEPALLEVLDGAKPGPPPIFMTEGIDAIWRAGRDGRLRDPSEHLALLASLYSDRISKLQVPNADAFLDDPERTLHPTTEQFEGVLALVQRLEQARIAFLADSVGLGKTVTSLGVAAYMKRNGLALRIALIAPRKLREHWEADADRLKISNETIEHINRHQLERLEESDALKQLSPYDLIIIEEAHETLRNRRNQLWMHLRAHLRAHVNCRVFLVSATPWNTSREDIYNYVLLAWNEGSGLADRYPALASPPLLSHLNSFRVAPASSLPVSRGVSAFLELPRDRYQEVFDGVFVQRTRSRLEAQKAAVDFPERRVFADNTPPSEAYDGLFATLAAELPRLRIPYREPFLAFQRSATKLGGGALDDAESNLERSFLTQLYKRAESSLFALAASLETIKARLHKFRDLLLELRSSLAPKSALDRYLLADFVKVKVDDADPYEDEQEANREALASDQKARLSRVATLLSGLTDKTVCSVLDGMIADQIVADLAIVDHIQQRLTFDLDEQSPKDLLLLRRAREAYAHGRKPILVAGYADTGMRAFLRVIDAMPEARVALVLGNGQAWLHRPDRHNRKPLEKAEWEEGRAMPRTARGAAWIVSAQRGSFLAASDALDAFAPRARFGSKILLEQLGGEIDVLVGSEAISVGHNLQDSTCLVQLDLPWNPMVIEQRIGRVDRRGGGRADVQRPHSRKIVDIHYCWSDAAIEQEVQLRTRLRARATGAIEDTNFDELLLYELHDRIQKIREVRAREQAAASVLGIEQQRIAEQRGHSPELSATVGSELDALRLLSKWRSDRDAIRAPDTPLACGSVGEDRAFWVTVELDPRDGRGASLAGKKKALASLPIHAAANDSDLEAVVRALLANNETLTRPGLSLHAWTEALHEIDAKLQCFREAWLSRHNKEVHARVAGRLGPHGKADPSQKLRNLVVDARDALISASQRVSKDSATAALLMTRRERLKFLHEVILEPHKLSDVIAEVGEKATQDLILHLRDHADRVLREEFDSFFERLAGGLWQTKQTALAADAQTHVPAFEGLWSDLRLCVIAVTFAGTGR